jgi:hypothetical protein
MIDPFAIETVILYKPVTVGERTVKELRFKPPVTKDIFYAGSRYQEGSIPFTHALICSLTGESELIIDRLVPEDWANEVVIADRSYQRYCGRINLFKQKDENENPTTADIPPETSTGTSAE